MRNITTILFAVIAMTWVSQAHAFIDIRGHAGLLINEPAELNDVFRVNGVAPLYIFPDVGADVLIKLGASPVKVGGRWDYGQIKVGKVLSGASADASLLTNRFAALGELAIWDGTVPVSVVASVGVSHSLDLDINSALGSRSRYDKGKAVSFSIGLNNGLKIGPLRLLAEGGYEYFVIDEITGPSGSAGFKINLSGMYVIGHLGFGF